MGDFNTLSYMLKIKNAIYYIKNPHPPTPHAEL